MSQRRFVGSSVVVLVGSLALAGCGGSTPRTEEAAPVAASAPAPALAPWGRPRLRLGVGQFAELEAAKNLLKQMGLEGVGPLITEQIQTRLSDSGRVNLMERSQLGKVIGNLQLEKESELSKYIDQSTTVETGKMKGVQAMLVGTVTQFEPNISGGGGGLDVPALGGLKYHQDKAVVGIEIRLVDQATGKVLVAASGTGEILTKNAEGSISYAGISGKAGLYSRTPLAQATNAAIGDALGKFIRGLEGLAWEGGVAQVAGPEKVYIDAGEDLGLKPGQRFRVVHRGAPIQGPDGAVLGFDDTEAGVIEVTQVQEKMSVAKVVEGDGPKKAGDRVRYLPAN